VDNQGSCSHLVNYISPLLVTCKSISKREYLNILNDDIYMWVTDGYAYGV